MDNNYIVITDNSTLCNGVYARKKGDLLKKYLIVFLSFFLYSYLVPGICYCMNYDSALSPSSVMTLLAKGKLKEKIGQVVHKIKTSSQIEVKKLLENRLKDVSNVTPEMLNDLRNVLRNSNTVVSDLKKMADSGVLDQLFPRFSDLKQVVKPSGEDMYVHTWNFLTVLEQIEKGDWTEFCANRKGKGEEIDEATFMSYKGLFSKIAGDKEKREMIYLSALLHDWGSVISLTGHEKMSGDIIRIRLEAMNNRFSDFFKKEHIDGIEAIASNHVIMGTLYLGERSPGYLLKKAASEDLLTMLTVINFCDVGSILGGKFLTNKKAKFFLNISDKSAFEDFCGKFLEYRLKQFVGNLSGESVGRDKEIIDLHSNLTRFVDEKSKKILDKHLSDTIEVFDYGIFVFQSLTTENLMKLLLLISQIVELAVENGYPANWVEFPPNMNKGLLKEILDLHKIDEFTFDNIKSKVGKIENNQIYDICGFRFKFEDGKIRLSINDSALLKEEEIIQSVKSRIKDVKGTDNLIEKLTELLFDPKTGECKITNPSLEKLMHDLLEQYGLMGDEISPEQGKIFDDAA